MSLIILSSGALTGSLRPQQMPPASGPQPPPVLSLPVATSLDDARLSALDPRTRRVLAMQVALDRAGFSPGEIDGQIGGNTERALRGFQQAQGLPATGELNGRTVTSLGDIFLNPVATYGLGADDVAGPFAEAIPGDMMQKAALPALGYTSIIEMLAERFHCSPKLLERLNPGASFAQGEIITVPNVEPFTNRRASIADGATVTGRDGSSGGGTKNGSRRGLQATPGKQRDDLVITVTDRTKTLTLQSSAGETVFQAPVTIGSKNDPLPVGEWKVTSIDRNPTFHYNPDLFWDANPSHANATLAPGPNNPVGVVWIDLSKEHYGIHGTPEPSRIGYTESHGCIRLTNWDAVRLASLVAAGTKVILR